MNRLIILFILLLTITSCVYFNTFYNAKVSLKNAKKIINLMDYRETDLPPQAKALLDESIANSKIVIENHPDSKFVEQAYYIIGTGLFLKEDYSGAKKYFSLLTNLYENSKYYNESVIYMSICDLELNKSSLDVSSSIIELSERKKNKYDRYLLSIYNGKRNILSNNIDSVYYYYENAIKHAINNDEKIKIYNKLINVAESYDDYDRIISYFNKIYPFLLTDKDKKEIKLLSIDYHKKNKNYDFLLLEIQEMLNQSMFNDKRITLLLQLAKVYYELGDYSASEAILYEITELYSKKNETAEAYYLLGEIAIKRNFNLSASIDFFNKSEKEKRSSTYAKKSKKILEKINLRNNSLSIIDSLISGDALLSDSLIIANSVDSMLFNLAQSYYFDFNQVDSAISRHALLVDKFPGTDYYPKSLFVLSLIDSLNPEWKSNLSSEFPDFNITNVSSHSDNSQKFSDIYYKAIEMLDLGFYDKAYKLLLENFIATDNKEILFYLGYINEIYTLDTEGMLSYYIKYINNGRDSEKIDLVKNKLATYFLFLNINLNNSIYERNFSDCYYTNMSTIITDHTLHYECIEEKNSINIYRDFEIKLDSLSLIDISYNSFKRKNLDDIDLLFTNSYKSYESHVSSLFDSYTNISDSIIAQEEFITDSSFQILLSEIDDYVNRGVIDNIPYPYIASLADSSNYSYLELDSIKLSSEERYRSFVNSKNIELFEISKSFILSDKELLDINNKINLLSMQINLFDLINSVNKPKSDSKINSNENPDIPDFEKMKFDGFNMDKLKLFKN